VGASGSLLDVPRVACVLYVLALQGLLRFGSGTRLRVCCKLQDDPQTRMEFMNSAEQKAFLQATAWLRPYTRWAAAFALKTEGFLPLALRNLPLKLVKMLLARQHKSAASGGKSC
jgi:hypothetical protein